MESIVKKFKIVMVVMLLLTIHIMGQPVKREHVEATKMRPITNEAVIKPVEPLNPIEPPKDAFESEGKIEDILVRVQNVRFTSYHTNDGTSGNTTASGLSTNDFEVNDRGWYTYKDKVVLATATKHCTELKKGVCGKYNELPSGFNQYELFDEITINVSGKKYEAIVLDVCGASYWDEPLQRYDIFVSSGKYVTDTKGSVIL